MVRTRTAYTTDFKIILWFLWNIYRSKSIIHFVTNVAPVSAITSALKNCWLFQVGKKNYSHEIPLNVSHRAFKESPKEGIYLQGCKHTQCLGGTCLGNWGK